MKAEYKELSLWEALAVIQREAPEIKKSEEVDTTKEGGKMKYTFAGLNTVWSAISSLMDDLGLVWTCSPDIIEVGAGNTRLVLKWCLHHIPSKQSREGIYPLKGERPQEIGSGITYGRRYALVAVLNLRVVNDDDDAQAAEERAQLTPSQQAQAGRTPRKVAQRAPARARQQPPPVASGEAMSDRLRGHLFALVKGELGMEDRGVALKFMNEAIEAKGGTPVTSVTELTTESAGWVIEAATEEIERRKVAEPTREGEGA